MPRYVSRARRFPGQHQKPSRHCAPAADLQRNRPEEDPSLPDWLIALIAAPFAGSLLGVLVRRLPERRPVAFARSCCEACAHPLGPADLVPLLSYAALRGRCRFCGARIAPFHPLIELAALAVTVSAVLAGQAGPQLWAGCALGWGLLALAWIDWEHLILPDALTLPLIPAGLAATWWLDPDSLTAHAAGAAAGYLVLRGVAIAYRALRRREGLGEGDAKLLAVAGAWTGWGNLPLIVLLAALAGIALALAGRAAGGRLTATTTVPFGPCLAMAIWAVWLWGG